MYFQISSDFTVVPSSLSFDLTVAAVLYFLAENTRMNA
jgi:hypothetical protein